jgi:drug/metabolite transporter (DMT)-like permease
LLIAAAVAYGIQPFVVNGCHARGCNDITLIFVRNWLSILPAFLLCRHQAPDAAQRIRRAEIVPVCAAAILCGVATPLFLFASYQYVDTGLATTVHYIYPTLVVIGCFLFLRERLRASRVICAVLGLLGVALFYIPALHGAISIPD